MSSIVVAGDTSGSVTLQAPAVAGSTVLTLPSTSGVLGVPPGTLIQWAGATAPTGYLTCPTTATNISRSTYSALFTAIGTLWGVGDGSTTFGLPYFATDQVGVQVGAGTIGTNTVGVVLTHQHATNSGVSSGGGGTVAGGALLGLSNATATTMTPTGGTANLPAGNRVMYCIKY